MCGKGGKKIIFFWGPIVSQPAPYDSFSFILQPQHSQLLPVSVREQERRGSWGVVGRGGEAERKRKERVYIRTRLVRTQKSNS